LLKRCLEDKIPLNRIMAMTFTDAAAAEMKKRLSKELNKRYKEAPDDYLKQQMVYLQTARISTIHSFCLSVIQQHYDIIGLDPAIAQNQLSEGTLSSLKSDAFMDAWQDFIYTNKEDAIRLSNFFSPRSEEVSSLMKTVLKLAETAHSSFDEDGYYDMVLANARPIRVLTELPDEIYNAFMDMNHHNVERILKPLFSMVTIVKEHYPNKEKAASDLESRYNCFKAASVEDDYGRFCALMKQAKAIALPRINGIKDACPDYESSKSAMNKAIDNAMGSLYEESTLIRDHNAVEDIVISLVELARATRRNFAAKKREIRGMDFDDMEHFCLEILKARDGIVAAQMRPLFDEIMIYEFQDTNEIQNAIINLIA
ncbi:MAG: UvrD-helicase domain-containing protein, partial [Erysipelotrichaceae bacterium]|nr:UvrD-helicase domain-containing protein [Erysipelotrichaceae bacterium]